jgi:hypothetical protein
MTLMRLITIKYFNRLTALVIMDGWMMRRDGWMDDVDVWTDKQMVGLMMNAWLYEGSQA